MQMSVKRDILIGLVILAIILAFLGAIVGLVLFITKGMGILLLLLGIFLAVFYPEGETYQPGAFMKTGAILGIVFIIIGLALIFFF